MMSEGSESSPTLLRTMSERGTSFLSHGAHSSINNPTNALILQVHAKNFNLIKAVSFQRDWSVHTALLEIWRRLQINDDSSDKYSIFIPGSSEEATGKYLEDKMANFTNSCGNLAPRSIIQLREKPARVMVVSEEGEGSHQRVSLQDDSVGILLQLACNHFHCNPKDFELWIPETNGRPGRALSPLQTLFEQGIENAERVVITMKRKKRKFIQRSRSAVKVTKHGSLGGVQRSSSVTVSQPMFVKTTRDSDSFQSDCNSSDLSIFGQHLTRALFQNGKLVHSVPPLVVKCIEYIETKGLDKQGIFRISSKLTELDKIKEKLDSTDVDVDLSNVTDVHIVTNLLKTYLRSLTEPPVPFDLYHRFLELAKRLKTDMHLEIKRKQFAELLLLLPEPNAQLLRILVPFLAKVAGRSARNRMPTANIATIFGPILMLSPEAESNPMCVAMDSHAINDVTQFMIENHDLISSTIRPPTEFDLESPFNLFNIRSQLLTRISEKPVPPSPFIRPLEFQADLDSAVNSCIQDLFQSQNDSLANLFSCTGPSKYSHTSSSFGFVRALYNYRPSTPKELALHRGDVIRVIEKDDTEGTWWKGELNHLQGVFPQSFCSFLVDSIDKLPPVDEPFSENEDPLTESEDLSEGAEFEFSDIEPLEMSS